jgi:hypothetical protein
MKARSVVSLAIGAALLAGSSGIAGATHAPRVAVNGQANVRVWIDGGDVFPGYGDVTIWVRADRDCYSTLFLVDTSGYIHVLNPDGYAHDGWLAGGRSYCYRACDLGLDGLEGSGIAYVFAVGSPVPFDYSYYGAGVFVGGFGFRVAGDPFVACRQFYMSMLPAGCRWDYVGVGYTRFYVREWVRYPAYLCAGGPGFHVRVGDACRVCADAYASYRCNVAAPWDAIRPVPRFKEMYGTRPAIQRAPGAYAASRGAEMARPSGGAIDAAGTPSRSAVKDGAMRPRSVEQARVVSTSRGLERGSREIAKSAWKGAARERDVARGAAIAAPSRPNHTGRAAQPAGAQEKGARKRSRQAQ